MKLKKIHRDWLVGVLYALGLAFCLSALVFSGATTVVRTFEKDATEKPLESEADRQQLAAGAPSADEAPEGVAGGGQPAGEPKAYLTFPALIKPLFKLDSDLKRPPATPVLSSASLAAGARMTALGSTWLISSRLGRQFTLVGARPSGTG
jgi:hypothetical protein